MVLFFFILYADEFIVEAIAFSTVGGGSLYEDSGVLSQEEREWWLSYPYVVFEETEIVATADTTFVACPKTLPPKPLVTRAELTEGL